jgi:chromosome segregation ATPase
MAVEKQFNIKTEADTTEVDKLVSKLDELIEAQQQGQKEAEDLNKKTDDIGKAAKSTEKGVGKLTKGFKGAGLALKGLGIGLAIEAFTKFKEILGQNQEVVDFFNTAMNAASIAVNDLFSFVSENAGTVIEAFKGVFNNPLESIKELGAAIKANIIERFESMIDSLGFAATAVKEFFKGNFEEAKEAATNAGKELVDVATGVDNSFDKTVKMAKEAGSAIKDYAIETTKTAQAQTELAKQSERALIINEGLIAKYENQAEKLRQTRDNERASIEDRLAASRELQKTLQKQQEQMLKNAQTALDSAQANVAVNATEENKNAVLEAQNRLADIRNQIQTQNSEQQLSHNALLRERQTLEDEKAKSAIEAELTIQEAQAETMRSEMARLNRMDEIAQQRFNAEKIRLQEQINLEEEGSARQMELQQELTNLTSQEAARQIKIADQKAKAEEKIEKQKRQAIVSVAGSTLQAVAGFAKQGSDLAKGIAIAQATISTAESAVNAYKSTVGIPVVGPVLAPIAAAAAVAAGVKQVQNIASTDPMGGSGGAPSIPTSPSPSSPAASQAATAATSPSFNVVQGSQQNQLLGDVSEGVNRPTRAYVVGKDVSTQQEADRNRVSNAKLAG